MSKVLGWHFAAEDRRLGYGDGRLIVKGRTLRYTGKEPIAMCKRGLHASERIIDALRYAPSSVICRVELSGDVIKGDDKMVAVERKCLWWLDATDILWEMACWSAEQVLPIWEKRYPGDKRPHQAIAARRGWLAVEVTDDELRAAYSAADSAAHPAAYSAACSAAYLAAESAADSAADSASREAQNKKLTALVMAAHRRQK